jgi:hypothetical protein
MACYDSTDPAKYFGISSTTIYPISDVVFNFFYLLTPSTGNLIPSSLTSNPISNPSSVLPTSSITYQPLWLFGGTIPYTYQVFDFSANTFSSFNYNVWVIQFIKIVQYLSRSQLLNE